MALRGKTRGLFSVRTLAAKLAVAVLLSTATAIAPAAVAAPAAESYTFAFHEADVAQVAEAILGGALGINYSIDPGVAAKLSFRIDQRLTRAQLLEAFETTLASNDIVLVRQGNTLVLTPRSKAKTASGVRSIDEAAHQGGYETVAVPLSHATPSQVAKALEAVSGAGSVVYADDQQNLLILGGTSQEISAALQTVHVFDKGGMDGAKIRWFDLQRASATGVASDLQSVLQAGGLAGVRVVPLKRLNGLFAFAHTDAELDQVAGWIAKLDVPSHETASSLFIYHPRNASAEGLSHTLSALLGVAGGGDGASGSSSAAAGAPGGAAATASQTSGGAQDQNRTPPKGDAYAQASGPLSLGVGEGPIRISADKDTNTLLVSASSSQWVQIERALDELDRQPSQVLIEASIVEVTLTDDTSFGVDWSVLNSNGQLGVQNINNSAGAVSAATPGFSVAYLGNNIKVALNALGSKSKIQVVSSPKIVILDNHTASLDVGDQVPIITQSSQGTLVPGSPLVNTVDYRSTGVILKVTPRVTGDSRITMDVDQEVSEVAATTTSSINSPTISQREFQSTLILDDGAVVALGGLISGTKGRTYSGIPYLMNIPVAGALFRSNSLTNDRSELIVLLTAKIVRDRSGSDRVIADLLADMHDIDVHDLLHALK